MATENYKDGDGTFVGKGKPIPAKSSKPIPATREKPRGSGQ